MMKISKKVKFFNFFRNLVRIFRLDYLFPRFTCNKKYANIFVRCIPQNYRYPKYSMRKVYRKGIWFELDLSEYMDWVIYYGLSVENRDELYSLVKKGMTLIDIGSNIGETLLNFAKLSGQDGKVYGFEPVPFTFEKCRNNISLNKFNNVSVVQIALSNKEEVLYFQDSNNNNSGGVFMNKSSIPGSNEVEAISLDAYVERIGIEHIDFIKIDVEGFESNVLEGARNTCLKFKPKLFVEVDDVNLKRQGSSAKALLELITSYGYNISEIETGMLMKKPVNHYDILAEPKSN